MNGKMVCSLIAIDYTNICCASSWPPLKLILIIHKYIYMTRLADWWGVGVVIAALSRLCQTV